MSGGSWGYLCHKMEDAADSLLKSKDAARKAFGKSMLLHANAMHDIEWVDSGDYGSGDEIEAIELAIGRPVEEIKAQDLIKRASKVVVDLEAFIEKGDTC
jgi:hypothetical protein